MQLASAKRSTGSIVITDPKTSVTNLAPKVAPAIPNIPQSVWFEVVGTAG